MRLFKTGNTDGQFKNSCGNGFTLAELLIVVAIIAVLVGVSIPLFSNHLEKSREAVDFANVRSAWSVVTTAEISNSTEDVNVESSGAYYLDVELKQAQKDWQTTMPITVAGISSDDTAHWLGAPRPGGTCRVKRINGTTYLYWNGSTISGLSGIEKKQKHFWTQNPVGDTIYLIDKVETRSKNMIDPITLAEGDSFTIPKSCIVPNGTKNTDSIFAFYLVENENGANGYKGVLDSGWIQDADLQNFTPPNGGLYVTNPDDYYKIDYQGESIKFTITKPEGLTLLINNNTWNNMDTIMNDVYIDK